MGSSPRKASDIVKETMNPELLTHLRSCVTSANARHSCLRDLSDEHLVEVYVLIKNNKPSRKIAWRIQVKWGYHRNKKRRSIAQAVIRFADRAMPMFDHGLGLTKQEHKKALVRADQMMKELDAMDVLRWAIMTQQTRCAKWVKRELHADMPIKAHRMDLKLLGELAVKLIDKEIEVGIRKRVPTETVHEHRGSFEAVVRELPGEGVKLAESMVGFTQLAEKKMLTLTVGEDGVYECEKRTQKDRNRSIAFGECGGIGSATQEEGKTKKK
jgi:hypothetical protein